MVCCFSIYRELIWFDLVVQPDDYFAVFSLRNWSKLRGDVLTSELVSGPAFWSELL